VDNRVVVAIALELGQKGGYRKIMSWLVDANVKDEDIVHVLRTNTVMTVAKRLMDNQETCFVTCSMFMAHAQGYRLLFQHACTKVNAKRNKTQDETHVLNLYKTRLSVEKDIAHIMKVGFTDGWSKGRTR
jgi:hypothetical protein